MLCNISKLVVMVVFAGLAVGCQSKNPPLSDSGTEELRSLTPEQEKKLLENAERMEQKEVVRQPVKNDKGEIVGTISSQTTVIFLKPGGGFGGGRFSVNTSCSSSCSGIPTVLDPSNPNNTCSGITPDGCSPSSGSCTTCTCKNGCSCTCTTTKTGFGNFGGFIAMESEDSMNVSVAYK